MEQAMFAAGRFWGVQDYFDKVPGVMHTDVGFSGGSIENPTYEEVAEHTTGHAEAILIEFDTSKVSYEILCKHFFRMHDPTQLDRQGDDVGDDFRSAIFYLNEYQKEMAEKVRAWAQADWDNPIVTQIEPAGPFYEADHTQQKYTERTGHGAARIAYEPIDA
jgi:methionine-S-sulfoxide reductase